MTFKQFCIETRILYLIIILPILIIGCKESYEEKGDSAYLNEINQWHQKRIENLKKENGWLNLVGLYWLKNGENKFGSAKDNDIVFPSNAPEHIGFFYLKDSIVTAKILPGVNVLNYDSAVTELELQNDLSENTTVLKLNSLRWFIIKRGEKLGVRLRDLDAPLVKEFRGIERFPVNIDWRINAKFMPYDSPQKIQVPNVLGNSDEETISGKLVFQIRGKEFALDPLDSGKRLFIIFADQTNGETTYGAGRFLYTDTADSSGNVILDFNKTYNPPCIFTKYATCPLPPQQNRLAVKITAGEKNFGEGH